MTPQTRSVVVIPTYEEAANVREILDSVLSASPASDVLVVDDSSPDGTAALVQTHAGYGHRVHLLIREEKNGLGAAYRAGFAWALRHGYAEVVQMDADLSHPAAAVPQLLKALDTADIAVGSRYVPGGAVRDWPLGRRLISRAGNLYVRLVLGLSVHDTTAGFKAFRRDALLRLRVLESASNGYSFQIENAWRASRLGLRVREVPITFRDRDLGSSKMSGAIVREALLRVFVWRCRELTGASVDSATAQSAVEARSFAASQRS